MPLKKDLDRDIFSINSVGVDINPFKPFLLVIFHPVTTELNNQIAQVETLLSSLEKLKMQTVWIWPNIDAGSGGISKVLRKYRENNNPDWLCFIKHLDPITYQKSIKSASCLVGNSSSFVRDSTFSGVPVVLVGNRQQGREVGKNSISVPVEETQINKAIKFQLDHGFYDLEYLYGNGHACEIIVDKLKKYQPKSQKQISYAKHNEHINS